MKTFARYSLLLSTCLSLAAVSTCRNRDDNGGDGGKDELPAEVQKAVDEVVAQLDTTSEAIGGAVDGFASVDLNDDGTFGDCPEVIFILQDNVASLALTFEPGCESEYYEDNSVSGSISIVFDRNAGAFDADFDAFTVDGHTTTGDLHVSRVGGSEFRTWTGSVDISTTGVGSVVGDTTLEINAVTQTIVQTASHVYTNADGEVRSVDVEGVVIRPVANGNFIPEDGTITFEIPNAEDTGPDTITIVVEFDANSPVDGTVKVTFSGGTVENYPLSGF